jgi:error-prone DNA polymerase
VAGEYAELHCHSAFSFLDGASNPEELVFQAKRLGLAALALTDHDDLGGVVRFAHTAKELAVEAIVGTELTLDDQSHITLLVAEAEGYKNLCHLISHARNACERGSPRVSIELLAEHSRGLVALTGCPHGKVARSIVLGDESGAAASLDRLHQMFGDNLFIEIWNHHLHQEAVIANGLLDLSARTAIPYVVTNNVHYARPEKRIIHDVLTCIRHEVILSTAGRRLRPNGSWYMKSPQEMEHLWRHHPEGIKNTLVVAERCQFRHGWLRPPLPAFAIPNSFKPDVESASGLLEKLVWDGAALRYTRLTEKHIKQLNHELSLINRMELAPYFLIVWDIVRFAREQGIAVQGRGSAANSAACYCLFITAVDPIGMDLLFERFLSEGRNEPPDIDLDIAHQERETVLQYVYEKYGRQHAAMVCEVITYRGRSAVRDAARVLGFSQEQADRLATMSSYSEAADAARHLAEGGVVEAGLDLNDRRVQMLIRVVAGLHQLPRHRSIHVGGFVLSGELLGDVVPIEPASMAGRTVIQWDKDDLDLAGLIKIDLLGLGMLTMIQEALKYVKQHRDIDIDLGRLNMRDPAIYDMLRRADTVGLFQVESRAQMSILPKLNPTCFYDIIVSIALVRPGPIQGNIIHPYLRRRRGEEPVTYLHPSLEPILKRTLGVPLFQEQGMRLAVVAAGFTPSQADHLRRVMSHKRSLEKMDKLCQDLAAGMKKNEFTEEAINTITHQLRAFANYGFPESHAASFSLLVYASAFLKLYFAPEFYCAMLNAQPMGFYSPATLIRDAIRHGVEVRPADLSKSSWDCTLERDDEGSFEGRTVDIADLPFSYAIGDQPYDENTPQTFSELNLDELIERDNLAPLESEPDSLNTGGKLALRVGLRYVRGLGKRAKDALAVAWDQGGLFTSFDDVLTRSGLAASDLKLLARAGAFESLFPGRRDALWETLSRLRKQRETPLLDLLEENKTQKKVMVPMSELEEINADYKTLGLTTGRHPMVFYRKWAEMRKIRSCAEMNNEQNGNRITVAGGVICRQRPETAKGFVFLTMEDETGMANVIVRPQLFEQLRKSFMSSYIAITGLLQSEQGVVNLLAEDVKVLPALAGDPDLPARDFH